MRTISLLFFISLFTTAIWAQDGAEIKGTIVDLKTGAPLENAGVMLQPGNHGLATSKDGSFVFSGLKVGTYHLLVKYLGYLTIEKDIELKSGEHFKITLKMKEDVRELMAVEIRD
jgi:uncharacterized membrane protein